MKLLLSVMISLGLFFSSCGSDSDYKPSGDPLLVHSEKMDWEYNQLRHYCMEILFSLEEDVISAMVYRNFTLNEFSVNRQRYGYQMLKDAFMYVAKVDDLINALIKDSENIDWFELNNYDDFQFLYYRNLKSLDQLSNPNNSEVVKEFFFESKDNVSEVLSYSNGLFTYLVTAIRTGYGQFQMDGVEDELTERPDLTTDLLDFGADNLEAGRYIKHVPNDGQLALETVINLLTLPKFVQLRGEKVPWEEANFKTTLFGAIINLKSIRNEMMKAIYVVMQHYASIPLPHMIEVNHLSVMPYNNQKFAITRDSIEINLALVVFDTTEQYKVEYWIDDTTTKSSMTRVYRDRPIVIYNLPKGKHTVFGRMEIKKYGINSWIPFRYEFEAK